MTSTTSAAATSERPTEKLLGRLVAMTDDQLARFADKKIAAAHNWTLLGAMSMGVVATSQGFRDGVTTMMSSGHIDVKDALVGSLLVGMTVAGCVKSAVGHGQANDANKILRDRLQSVRQAQSTAQLAV